jgi:Holliday junction resolvase RusA-like endonuclease
MSNDTRLLTYGVMGRWISFTVAGVAAPAGSKRGFVNPRTGKVIITDMSRRKAPWMAVVAEAARAAMTGGLLEGPLGLTVSFVLPRPAGHYGKGRNAAVLRAGAPVRPAVAPDCTKLLRAVEDALKGIVWRDDSQVVAQYAEKLYGEPAECFISVAELNPSTRTSEVGR